MYRERERERRGKRDELRDTQAHTQEGAKEKEAAERQTSIGTLLLAAAKSHEVSTSIISTE